jgi:hypothetical protein
MVFLPILRKILPRIPQRDLPAVATISLQEKTRD